MSHKGVDQMRQILWGGQVVSESAAGAQAVWDTQLKSNNPAHISPQNPFLIYFLVCAQPWINVASGLR